MQKSMTILPGPVSNARTLSTPAPAGIAGSLADAKEILVAGPTSAKTAFVKHLNEHAHDLRAKVVAIETVDHPSNIQLLDYARKHFRSDGGMG